MGAINRIEQYKAINQDIVEVECPAGVYDRGSASTVTNEEYSGPLFGDTRMRQMALNEGGSVVGERFCLES
jgi:hypothetical protein